MRTFIGIVSPDTQHLACRGVEFTGGGPTAIYGLVDLLKQLFELLDELDERDTEDSADLAQLQQVQATCAGFIIADEGLGLSQCFRHIDLPETGFRPKLAEQRQESFLLLPVRR
jgi:hypothetical protein